MVLFRGTGADAMRYVEADRSRADDYYLGDATGISYTVLDASGEAISRPLSVDDYAGWVDWINADTGERMGRPRLAGSDRQGSPRFAEMVINTPKSLSIAAALHPEVSESLDAAQQGALSEIQRWLAQHSVTRVGPRGKQEVVPIEHMQIVGITHHTSRAGDPHRHIHMQVGTRVWAAGAWRALDTAAMFRQQGAIRALGSAVIAASPELAAVLNRYDLTLDPVTGEVTELEPFNALMSKRGAQVRKNLERLEAEWEAAHPGETMGPVVSSRLTAKAWAYERPAKKPTTMREEAEWLTELREAGYDPETLTRKTVSAPTQPDELSVQEIASRALDRCAAGSSAWTRHDVQEHATRIITEHGVRAHREELRELIALSTALALEDCFSILPTGAAAPEHVAHLTSLRVVQVETELRDLLTARKPQTEQRYRDVSHVTARLGQQLDAGQLNAAAAVASTDPLVIVEGAAGSGKTTMLATAIAAANDQGRRVRVVAPTKRAADVARQELGVPATSVAALVHAHGYRWNEDGVWTRLTPGATDSATGAKFIGPPPTAVMRRGDRIVVDEAGMLDQDAALALLTVAAEAGATVALAGDRAQLAAVGRGGVLDMAAQIRGCTFDMAEVHRFTDPDYADLTVRMRDRRNPGDVFDQLERLGLIRLHADGDELQEHIAQSVRDGETITVASNEDATRLNERIREERIARGLVEDAVTTTGGDGLSIGAGDLIQTRRNDAALGVANRQQWIVQRVEPDGSVWVRDAHDERKREHTRHLPAAYVHEHAHLSYAATAYGVQGVTAPASNTILSDGINGAAVYVGMTRGRGKNALHIIAESRAEARALFIDATERDRADLGLADATERAAEAVRGLVDDGPVKLVNTRVAQLIQDAEKAEHRAAWWERVGARLNQQHEHQQAEKDDQAAVIQSSTEAAGRVRVEVQEPLTVVALEEGTEHLAALDREAAAQTKLNTAGRFGRRAARKDHQTATALAGKSRARVADRWGTTPRDADTLTDWASRAAERAAARDPRVIEAEQHAEATRAAGEEMDKRHRSERRALHADIFGAERVRRDPLRYEFTHPDREASNAHRTAATARQEVAALRGMSVQDAATRIAAQREAAERARLEREARARQLHASHDPFGRRSGHSVPHRDAPSL
ncbi:MobF family relaxase [Microbacterium istanbulense]|uniref:MobF family relaxase n=1 Tax=Microbacterium istanbulense TaxID=3122049 RepID=A0ABU8LPU4_9MICO